jgi:hypothetical protein
VARVFNEDGSSNPVEVSVTPAIAWVAQVTHFRFTGTKRWKALPVWHIGPWEQTPLSPLLSRS